MDEIYEIRVICRNCGHVPVVEKVAGIKNGKEYHEFTSKKIPIPKCVTVKQFLMDMTCKNCGCEGYMGLLNQPG